MCIYIYIYSKNAVFYITPLLGNTSTFTVPQLSSPFLKKRHA